MAAKAKAKPLKKTNSVARAARFVKLVASKRKRKNPEGEEPVSRKSFLSDLPVADVGVGLGALTAANLTTRLVENQLTSRFRAAWVPYAVMATSGASFGLLWLLASKVKTAKRYKTAILVGAGASLAQTLLRILMPQFAWLLTSGQIGVAMQATGPAPTAGMPQRPAQKRIPQPQPQQPQQPRRQSSGADDLEPAWQVAEATDEDFADLMNN